MIDERTPLPDDFVVAGSVFAGKFRREEADHRPKRAGPDRADNVWSFVPACLNAFVPSLVISLPHVHGPR